MVMYHQSLAAEKKSQKRRLLSIISREKEFDQKPKHTVMMEHSAESQQSSSKRKEIQGRVHMNNSTLCSRLSDTSKGFQGQKNEEPSIEVLKQSSLGEKPADASSGNSLQFSLSLWFNSRTKDQEQTNEAIQEESDGKSSSTDFFVRAVRDPEVKFKRPIFAWERPDYAWNYWSFRMHYDNMDMRDEYPDATFESDKRRLNESLQRMQWKAQQAYEMLHMNQQHMLDQSATS